MLSKKSIKIISVVVLAVMLLMTIGSSVFAYTIPDPTEPTGTAGMETVIGRVLGIMQWAGFMIAVVVAMYLGISYITKSPEGKAEIKKQLPLYIGGIAVIVFASVIVTFIRSTLSSGVIPR